MFIQYLYSLLIILLLPFLLGCATTTPMSLPAPTTNNSSNSSVLQQQDQGITGLVTKVTGNQMPTLEENDSRNPPQSIQTKVWIFSGQITAKGTRWPLEQARQHSNLVGWTTTNTNGSFSVGLPPGEYTLFMEDGTDLYLNSFLGNGNYESVEVTEGEITEINIVNTEGAAF